MTAKESLPLGLAKLISSVPQECQTKLLDLHAKLRFDEDQLDCFLANHGRLTADGVIAFQHFLEQERANAAAKAAAAKPAAKPSLDGAAKRKSGAAPTSQLSDGVSAALGRARAAVFEAEVATPPCPKRARDMTTTGLEAAAPFATPESTPRPAHVSLKASLNGGKLEKPGYLTAASVELLGDATLWSGGRGGAYAWMDEALESRSAARDERLAAMEGALAEAMQRRHGEVVLGAVGVPTQAETVLCGRVVCEGLEGRLNERSILLQGSRAASRGATVQLNAAECQRLAAFPGQVVAVLGRSGMAGTTFHARDFLAGLPAPPAALAAEASLHMAVLSGPFCLRDGLDYSPLEHALEHVVRERPQVLVLLGPFLDASNLKVSSGETTLPFEKETLSFEDVYQEHVLPLLHRCLAPLRRATPPTEVLIVPSLEEVLCFHPLPQPPLDASFGPDVAPAAMEQLRSLGVRFLPNPAHVRVNGVRVSLTSADALSPVLREIVLRPDGKKIEEALRLLVAQRGLFPVVPRDPPQVSECRAVALDFPDGVPPDVCAFPSVSGTAGGTVVDGTVFVNPGALCRPAALGSFAELWLAPAAEPGAPLLGRVRVDIQKLG